MLSASSRAGIATIVSGAIRLFFGTVAISTHVECLTPGTPSAALLRRVPNLPEWRVTGSAELLWHPRAEGRQVISLLAGHQPLVNHDFLVDPFGAHTPQVRLQQRPRGHSPAAHC